MGGCPSSPPPPPPLPLSPMSLILLSSCPRGVPLGCGLEGVPFGGGLALALALPKVLLPGLALLPGLLPGLAPWLLPGLALG
jgi:hypothetical protein